MLNRCALSSLQRYLQEKENVVLAFIFGSWAKGFAGMESDLDIGIYVRDEAQEDELWLELSKISHLEVDLVLLNRAPASLVSNILKTGVPLVVKDKNLFLDLYLAETLEAEDFFEFAKNYREIYLRSRSLIPEDKTRLIERIHFLENEYAEIDSFKQVTLKDYQDDKLKRRNTERWTENIMNATIDIAKIILASEKKTMPATYEEALLKFGFFVGLNELEAKRLSSFARLRNALAHEYLGILYDKIKDFITASEPIYQKILHFLLTYME